MHIIMSFNTKFLLPALETIYTLFVHNEGVILHIFFIDLTEDERSCVERLLKLDGGHQIIWHLIEEDLTDKIQYDTGRFSMYTMYRFLAYKILDKTITRCLWLDSDLMIRGDVRELYDTDMGDEYYFVGAREISPHVAERFGEMREYTNTGVLVMNLEKLRSDDMMDEFWKYLFDPSIDHSIPDQDALNEVFRGKIRFVDQELWNRFPITVFNEEVPMEVIRMKADKARIVHFLSASKVWLDEYAPVWEARAKEHPFVKIMYEEYLDNVEKCVSFLEANAT